MSTMNTAIADRDSKAKPFQSCFYTYSSAILKEFKENFFGVMLQPIKHRYITTRRKWKNILNYEPAPKKGKTVPSAWKIMATVFWHSKVIILIGCMEKGKRSLNNIMLTFLDSSNAKLREKRTHLFRKKVLFHHDNEPKHSSRIAATKLVELYNTYPPYSSDLAPSEFFLFLTFKNIYLWKEILFEF